MKLYFHKFYTEAHRRWQRGAALANAIEAAGVEVSLVLDSTCDMAMCGAFSLSQEFDEVVKRHNEFLHESKRPCIPVVQLCWDLYPFHVHGTRNGMTDTEKGLWLKYVNSLKASRVIIAPSLSAARRISSFTKKKDIYVVPAACDPWWETATAGEGQHVLDVMRQYDDWGNGKVKQACRRLGIPYVESKGGLSFEEFKSAVTNARLLVCAYDEASTGGLTLLEGHALGKPVLVSNSPWNGAEDYFREKATYFSHRNLDNLTESIRRMWESPPVPTYDPAAWVKEEYSDTTMARKLVKVLKELP